VDKHTLSKLVYGLAMSQVTSECAVPWRGYIKPVGASSSSNKGGQQDRAMSHDGDERRRKTSAAEPERATSPMGSSSGAAAALIRLAIRRSAANSARCTGTITSSAVLLTSHNTIHRVLFTLELSRDLDSSRRRPCSRPSCRATVNPSSVCGHDQPNHSSVTSTARLQLAFHQGFFRIVFDPFVFEAKRVDISVP